MVIRQDSDVVMSVSTGLLLLLLVIHQTGAESALLSGLHAILVAQLENLLNQLLYLLHDGLVLLLVLLLAGLLWRLVARGEVGRLLLLLRLLRLLVPGVGNLVTAYRSTALLLLLSLA